jgi:hypothetical protein
MSWRVLAVITVGRRCDSTSLCKAKRAAGSRIRIRIPAAAGTAASALPSIR